jgi:hypothetical protein
MYVVIVSKSSVWNTQSLVGPVPPVNWCGSLPSHVAAFSYVKSFYGNFLSRSVQNIFHKIVLQFYVSSCLLTPHVVGLIFPALS